ncbi:MAG TPA: hypothetical protein VF110_10595 [Burkholderiales bacterium]
MRLLLLTLVFLAGAALAQEDVGMVDLVAGEVAFQAGRVKPYMKVREGDRFELPEGAQLRLVYFAGGRQERWQGPARFRVGKQESAALAGKPSQATVLPASVPHRLARAPELTRNAVFGGIAVRGQKPPGGETEETLREARATYARLRRELPADDLTPELFLYAALAAGPNPDSEEVKNLAARLAERQQR